LHQDKQRCPISLGIAGMAQLSLDRLNVFSLPTLWPPGHVELHRLPASTASV
jgi:hypothetical protein